MARVLGNDGEPITRASLSTVTYSVRDLTDAETDSTGNSLTISSVVFDDLQQDDPRWTVDSRYLPGKDQRWGYNFLAALPASLFNDFDVEPETPFDVTAHKFQVTVTFTPASGSAFQVAYKITNVPTW